MSEVGHRARRGCVRSAGTRRPRASSRAARAPAARARRDAGAWRCSRSAIVPGDDREVLGADHAPAARRSARSGDERVATGTSPTSVPSSRNDPGSTRARRPGPGRRASRAARCRASRSSPPIARAACARRSARSASDGPQSLGNTSPASPAGTSPASPAGTSSVTGSPMRQHLRSVWCHSAAPAPRGRAGSRASNGLNSRYQAVRRRCRFGAGSARGSCSSAYHRIGGSSSPGPDRASGGGLGCALERPWRRRVTAGPGPGNRDGARMPVDAGRGRCRVRGPRGPAGGPSGPRRCPRAPRRSGSRAGSGRASRARRRRSGRDAFRTSRRSAER